MVKKCVKLYRRQGYSSFYLTAAFFSLFAFLLFTFENEAMSESGDGELIDQIVAIVNGEPILLSQIQKKIDRGEPVSISFLPADASDSAVKKSLEDEINKTLILQEAKYLGFTFEKEEVEKELAAFLDGRMSLEALKENLSEQGVKFSDYLSDFKERLIIQRFQSAVIMPLIDRSEKALATFGKSQQSSGELVLNFRQIFLDKSKGALAPRVEQIRKRLAAGESFQKIAAKLCDYPESQRGIELKDVELGQLNDEVKQALIDTPEGSMSQPVSTEQGKALYLFFVEKKSTSGVARRPVASKEKLFQEYMAQSFPKKMSEWLLRRRASPSVSINYRDL